MLGAKREAEPVLHSRELAVRKPSLELHPTRSEALERPGGEIRHGSIMSHEAHSHHEVRRSIGGDETHRWAHALRSIAVRAPLLA